jgi:hypothetical protein
MMVSGQFDTRSFNEQDHTLQDGRDGTGKDGTTQAKAHAPPHAVEQLVGYSRSSWGKNGRSAL